MNRAGILGALIVFASHLAVAQTEVPFSGVHPNIERGFAAEKMYEFGNIDHVNLFNGNVSLTIPIGSPTVISDHLSFSLVLTYNSKLWENEELDLFALNGVDGTAYRKVPNTRANAGLGWLLSLGRLISPDETDVNDKDRWRYESADGADHVFDGPIVSQNPDISLAYTHDNSYLRLRKTGDTEGVVEFPDGQVQTFTKYSSGLLYRWRLTKTSDRFGNFWTVDYSTQNEWVIKDNYGRTLAHIVFAPFGCAADTAANQCNGGQFLKTKIATQLENYQTVLQYIELPSFGSTTTSQPLARYDFHYDETSVTRALCDTPRYQSDTNIVSVPLLTEIDLPDDTTFRAKYYQGLLPSGNSQTDCHAGEISQLQLPTKGFIKWTYDIYKLPVKSCEADPIAESSGIKTKSLVNSSDENAVGAVWTYSSALTPETTTQWPCSKGQWIYGDPPAAEVTTTVTAPNSDQTVYYFSGWPLGPWVAPPTPGFTRLEYGLPLSHKTTAGDKSISVKTCSGPCAPDKILQTVYVKYERDATNSQVEANRRLAGSRTVYNDDAGHYINVDSSDFDGVGHYRVTTKTSDFPAEAPAHRETKTAYNVADPDVSMSDASSSPPWVLNTFSSVTTTDTSGTQVDKRTREFCFDPQTGFLRGTRVIAPAGGDRTKELIAVFQESSEVSGNVGREWYLGGDTTPLSSSSALCSMLPLGATTYNAPGPFKYSVRHHYQSGVRSSSEYLNGETPIGFKILNQTIDSATGLPSASQDPASVSTFYTYDSLRRLKSVHTGTDNLITFDYSAPPATPRVDIQQQSANGAIKDSYVFDPLGRVRLRQTLIPPRGRCVEQAIGYDSNGRKSRESVWTTCNGGDSAKATTFAYDGRKVTATAPDGSIATSNAVGERMLSHTRSININLPGSSVSVEYRDGLGRTTQVTENVSADTPDLVADYTYDVEDHLRTVNVYPSGSTAKQLRTFEYDYRGFLTSESHPEAGQTSYSSYDARGHSNAKRTPTAEFFLEYDPAEHLTKISDGAGNELKKFDWSDTTGQLTAATRHNRLPSGDDIKVTELYGYNDAAARLTDKTTELARNGVTFKKLTQKYTFDSNGLLTLITYPTCAAGYGGCGQPSWPSIQQTYENGYLSSVNGVDASNVVRNSYATAFTYAPTTAVASIAHGNGLIETITPDPSGMPRPQRIAVKPCPSPKITQSPQDTRIPTGMKARLTVAATVTGTFHVIWYSSAGESWPNDEFFLDTPALSKTTMYWADVTNGCGTARSAIAIVTVDTSVAIGVTPGTLVLPGTPVTLTATYNATTVGLLHYQWYFQITESSSNPIDGATNNTYMFTPGNDSQLWVRVTDVSGNVTNASVDSGVVTIRVQCFPPHVTISSYPTNFLITKEETGFLTANGVGKGLRYSWYSGDLGQTGPVVSTLQTFGVQPVAPIQKFWVSAADGCGNPPATASTTVYMCVPIIRTQPQTDLVIPADGSANTPLSVVADPSNSILLHYQWYRGVTPSKTNPVPNSDSASLTVAPANADNYWVDVIGTCDASSNFQTGTPSAQGHVRTCSPAAITTNPFPSQVARYTNATLSVSAPGNELTYQWYRGPVGNVVNSVAIDGAQNSTYTFTPSADGGYWVRVINAKTCISDSILMTVTVCDAPAVTRPTVLNPEVMPGQTTTITEPSQPTDNFTYQWNESVNGGPTVRIVGATASSLTTPPITADSSFSVDVMSGVCKTSTLWVNAHACDMSAALDAGPSFTPIHSGDRVTLSFTGSPAPGTTTLASWYQGDSGDISHPISTNTTATSILVAPTQTTGYWVRLKSTVAGSKCQIDTGTITIRVCIPRVQQPPDVTINPGQQIPLTAVADVNPVTYQWYTIGADGQFQLIAGETSQTYIAKPTTTTVYMVRVTGNCGLSVDSGSITVTVCQPPVITSQPADASVTYGTVVPLTVYTTGTNVTYQWYQGVAGDASNPAAAGTASTLNVTAAVPANYWVRVTSICGTNNSTLNSRTVHLSVCTTPSITTQPQNATIFSSASKTLSTVAADSTGEPVHYQWYKGSTQMGTDSPTFDTGAVTSATQYHVHVSAGVCGVDSQTVTVSLCALGQAVTAVPDQQVGAGAVVHLTAPVSQTAGRLFRFFSGTSGDTSTVIRDWYGFNYVDVNPAGATNRYWYQVQDSASCVSSSGTTTISVCVPTITQQPGSIMITSGTSTPLSVAGTTTGLTYQWYIGTSGTTSSAIAGATVASQTVSPSVTTNYWVRVTGACNQFVDSNTAVVSVCQRPVITAQPVDADPILVNGTAQLQVSATGDNLTYQWYLSQTPGDVSTLAGSSSNILLVASVANTRYYWVRIAGTCGTVDSNAAAISVNPTHTQPNNALVASGSGATITFQATGTYLHYKWYSNSTQLLVPDSSTLFTGPITAQTSFVCVVTSGPKGSATVSSTVSLCNTIAVTSQSSQPSGSCTLLTPNVFRSGQPPPTLNYRWYKGARGDTTTLVGTGTTMSVCPGNDGSFWCRVTRTDTNCSADSQVFNVP